MQQDPKLQGGDIQLDQDNKFLKWLDNYWYHYKWHTLIAGFFIILFVVMLVQCVTDKGHDIVVAYCGSTEFMKEQTEGVRESLGAVMPEDFDGNGERYVEFVRYLYYSEEEIEAEKVLHDDQWTIAPAYVKQQLSDFRDFVQMSIATNDCSVYFLSPAVYEQFTTNPFRVLEEILDSVPTSAYDQCAVRLGDTDFYADDPALQEILPADTLVCLLTSGRPQNEKYQNSVAMFQAIVEE